MLIVLIKFSDKTAIKFEEPIPISSNEGISNTFGAH